MCSSGARVGRHAAMIEICASISNQMVTVMTALKSLSTEPLKLAIEFYYSGVRLTFAFCVRPMGYGV